MSGLFVDNDGNMSWRKLGYRARSAFAVCLSLAVLLGGGWYAFHSVDKAYKNYKAISDYPGPGTDQVTVEIPQGATENQMGQILVKAEVVKSTKAFVKAADDSGDASKFQAGQYRLQKHIPAAQAVSMLLDKKYKILRQFTIPEGMWMSDALKIIAAKTGIPLAQLQKTAADRSALGLPSWASAPNNPEGFLFPDTYQFDSTPTASEVLGEMTAEFGQVASSLDLRNKAASFTYSYKGVSVHPSPLQVLTVASILEAEVPAQYQRQVAGIIYNRMAANMPMGLDSQLHYAFQVPMNKLLPAHATTNRSLAFNSYLDKGLPPGPIDSPGRVAMSNALAPIASPNLFWVTVNLKTGETRFAADANGQKANEALFNTWCQQNKYPSGCVKAS